MTGTLHEDQYTFLIISCSFLLRMRNVSEKSCRENQNTHFMFNNFFFKSCRLWDNVEKYYRVGQATNDSMAHVQCMLVTKATNTHSEYAILIAFPLQQCLHERASMSHCLYCMCYTGCGRKTWRFLSPIILKTVRFFFRTLYYRKEVLASAVTYR